MTTSESEATKGAKHDNSFDWQTHPSVNSPRPCPWCSFPALHEQHCKQICLACGWYRSCVD